MSPSGRPADVVPARRCEGDRPAGRRGPRQRQLPDRAAGADRHLDPQLTAVLLALRRRLIDEHGATTAAELMLVDPAVLSYYHFLRINGWIGNLGQWLEAEFFQVAAPSAKLAAPFGSDTAKPFQGEEVAQRIAEQLMPLLDRSNRMLIRNLKALRERRQGPTPSVSIAAAGQVNVAERRH